MCDVHDRFSVMLIPRNLWCLCLLFSSVLLLLSSRLLCVHHSERLLISSRCEYSSLFVSSAVCVHKLYNRVLSVFGIAVVGVQHEQEGAEHTALVNTRVDEVLQSVVLNPRAFVACDDLDRLPNMFGVAGNEVPLQSLLISLL